MKIGELIQPRKSFGEELLALGAERPDLVVFDSDVCASTQTAMFKDAYPDRFYEMGIAEQNMVGAAAGMSTCGFVPFVSTFAVFLAKRAVDQIRVSIAYPHLNVKLNGAYGGIPTGKAGATHSPVADIAVMRAMPNMTVLVPGDPRETKLATRACLDMQGPVYLRTVRDAIPVIFDENHRFEIGRSYALREGSDAAVIATGMMTARALAAADALAKEGIRARVIHMPTIKPLDREAIIRAALETGRIVTVENHGVIGGLGGAVAETLCDDAPCRLRRIGFQDHFVESGDTDDCMDKYGMNVPHIAEAVRALLRDKR